MSEVSADEPHLHNESWKKIQQNTFTRWVNQHLAGCGMSINNLVSQKQIRFF